MGWVKAMPLSPGHWLLSYRLELPVPKLCKLLPRYTALTTHLLLSLSPFPSGLEMRVLASRIPGTQEEREGEAGALETLCVRMGPAPHLPAPWGARGIFRACLLVPSPQSSQRRIS